MSRFRFSFLPSKENHLASLSQVTILIGDAAHLLGEMFDERSINSRTEVSHIESIKRQCDEITKQISKSLSSTLITALDREDLHALAVALSDVMELIAMLAREAFSAGDAHTFRMQQLASVIKEMVGELNTLVTTISQSTQIRSGVQTIRRLERQGRDLYGEGIRTLFRDGSSPQIAIIYNELYANLAMTVSSCWEVGKLVELIALKNV